MRAVKFFWLSIVIAGVFIFMAPSTLATELTNPKTETKTNFSAGEVGDGSNVLKPDYEGNISITPLPPLVDENYPKGALAITNAPTLDFGTVSIKSGKQIYKAKMMEYRDTDGNADNWMPSMLTVEDLRGTKSGWSVSITGSDFITSSNHVLEGAFLTFAAGRQVYNQSEAGAAAITDPLKFDSKEKIELKKDSVQGYTAAPLLTAKADNGAAITSLVFDSMYQGDAEGEIPVEYTENSLNADITLTTIATTTPIADIAYRAELTWTLSQTPD